MIVPCGTKKGLPQSTTFVFCSSPFVVVVMPEQGFQFGAERIMLFCIFS